MNQRSHGRRVRQLAATTFMLLAVAGCTSSEETGEGRPTGASSAPATTTAQPSGVPAASAGATTAAPPSGAPAASDGAAATAPPTDFSGEPVAVRGAESAQLVAVIEQTADGVDRLTFQFDGLVPGYRVEELPRITAGPEGDVVGLSGQTFLQLSFAGTTPGAPGALSDDVPTNTDYDLPVIRQLVLVHNVGGDVRFGIGLDAATPVFRVVPLTGPDRLVLEVRPG